MTIDLDAIEARANAATPGPWTVSRSSDHPGERHIDAGLGAGVYVAMDVGADDAAFIANARTDIPALVARVRELEAAERELNAVCANERGEGEGPSEGWTWDGNSCAWLHGLDANGEYPDDGWTVEQTPAGQDLGWTWEHCGTRSDPYPYARDAMRAADIARAGGAT